jgi:hypothetical protein
MDQDPSWIREFADEHATPNKVRRDIRRGTSCSIVRRHSSLLHDVIRARFASQPPPSFAFKGGWASKRFLLVVALILRAAGAL